MAKLYVIALPISVVFFWFAGRVPSQWTYKYNGDDRDSRGFISTPTFELGRWTGSHCPCIPVCACPWQQHCYRSQVGDVHRRKFRNLGSPVGKLLVGIPMGLKIWYFNKFSVAFWKMISVLANARVHQGFHCMYQPPSFGRFSMLFLISACTSLAQKGHSVSLCWLNR